ncbi:TPA: hypothetical protein ACGIMR_000511 [Salmonella enterica subsp. enterica serovar Javiana]
MNKFSISGALYNWSVEVFETGVSVTARFPEEDVAPFERVSNYMNTPFPVMSREGIEAMIGMREEFEKGDHYALPDSYIQLNHKERMIIDSWREMAIREYEADALVEW